MFIIVILFLVLYMYSGLETNIITSVKKNSKLK